MLLVVIAQQFWYHFCAHFPHPKVVSQDGSDCLPVHSQFIRKHPDSQLSISAYQSVNSFNVVCNFWCGRSSWLWVIFHFFTTTLEMFVPFKNPCMWHTISSIDILQQLETFCRFLSKFDKKFQIDLLLPYFSWNKFVVIYCVCLNSCRILMVRDNDIIFEWYNDKMLCNIWHNRLANCRPFLTVAAKVSFLFCHTLSFQYWKQSTNANITFYLIIKNCIIFSVSSEIHQPIVSYICMCHN